jgi:hypothetical protein
VNRCPRRVVGLQRHPPSTAFRAIDCGTAGSALPSWLRRGGTAPPLAGSRTGWPRDPRSAPNVVSATVASTVEVESPTAAGRARRPPACLRSGPPELTRSSPLAAARHTRRCVTFTGICRVVPPWGPSGHSIRARRSPERPEVVVFRGDGVVRRERLRHPTPLIGAVEPRSAHPHPLANSSAVVRRVGARRSGRTPARRTRRHDQEASGRRFRGAGPAETDEGVESMEWNLARQAPAWGSGRPQRGATIW